MTATRLAFVDTETTGLDPARHEVWEIAVALDDGPIHTWQLPHSIATADPDALAIGGYARRYDPALVDRDADTRLKAMLAGVTVVGSNPAFDTAMLRARWGVALWHHRLIAVESVALGVLGYDRPKGLAAVADDMRRLWPGIPVPDHTAAGDVATLRAVYAALRAEGAA